jgi:mannose-1-phosphate guanylyltransferase
VLPESAKAREWAAAFAGADLPESNAAVMNAMRDQVFTLMQQVGPGDQAAFLKGLNMLSQTMSRLQRVELQARRVAVDEKAVQIKLDLIKEKAGKLIGEMEGRDGKPAVALTREDLLEKVREIYGAV